MLHTRWWRRLIVAAITSLTLGGIVVPAPALAHYDLNEPFVFTEGGSEGWNRYVGVCIPWQNTEWNIGNNPRHQALWSAMQKWNAESSEVYLYRAQATCNYMYGTSQPFIRVDWDYQCSWEFTWICDVGLMAENSVTAPPHSLEADEWSSNGQGTCHGANACTLWAEILVEKDYHDSGDIYWGDDQWSNYNNNTWAGRGLLAHEIGHAIGVALDIPRYVPSEPNDPQCDDFFYPASSNALMCGVIEKREWNITLKTHERNQLFDVYLSHP